MTSFVFFFNDTATTEIYTLSLHDALPICRHQQQVRHEQFDHRPRGGAGPFPEAAGRAVEQPGSHESHRSEEHTSELQSLRHLVCRLLLEKKKNISTVTYAPRNTAHISAQL